MSTIFSNKSETTYDASVQLLVTILSWRGAAGAMIYGKENQKPKM